MSASAGQGARAAAPSAATRAAPAAPQPSSTAQPPVAARAGTPAPRGTTRPAAGRSDTPATLRRVRAAAVLGCLLSGTAATGYLSTRGIEDSPRVQAAQLGHVADALAQLQNADSAAGEVIARSTLTRKPADTARLDSAVGQASSTIAQTAGSPRDLPVARRAMTGLTAYVRDVERARALSTSAPQKAATTYAAARADFTRTALDPYQSLWEGRLGSVGGYGTPGMRLALVLGGLTTGGLLLGSWWLARKTHRIINPGLAAATVLMGALTWMAFSPLSISGTTADQTNRVVQLVGVRSEASDARAAELGALLPGGNGAQGTWKEHAGTVGHELDGNLWSGDHPVDVSQELRTAWKSYATAHDTLAAATTPAARAEALHQSGAAYERLDTAFAAEIGRGDSVLQQDPGPTAFVGPALGLLTGTAAAAAAWAGITRRLKEYR